MWVRSQDKKILIKADGFMICKESPSSTNPYVKKKAYIRTTDRVMDARYVLGEYNTVERALQVLDEIQRNIVHQSTDYEDCDIAFQMPEV